MFHPLDGMGSSFGTPTKKYILSEMPVEYQQQLQNAATQPMFGGPTISNNLVDNCVILVNSNNSQSMHRKCPFAGMVPLAYWVSNLCQVNLLWPLVGKATVSECDDNPNR